ncbi:uncharacterized protein LOC134699951 isoform X2 [Mytilus trossulus]
MESWEKEEDDASLPFFNRKEGEVGIYMTIYDAKAENPKSYGSERFYYMDLTDKLFDHLSSADIVKLREDLEKKGALHGAYIERFSRGIVLAVGFDDTGALDSLWDLYQRGKLSLTFQDVIVNSTVLKKLKTTKIVLRSKILESEYNNCTNELLSRKMKRLEIKTREVDKKMVLRLTEQQKSFTNNVQSLKDTEEDIELSLGEFALTMKQILPQGVLELKTIREFETNYKMAKGTSRVKNTKIIDQFIDMLGKLRTTFTEAFTQLYVPLLQVHSICESEKQKQIKRDIRKKINIGQELMKPEAPLKIVIHPVWARKILPREQSLFRGLVCVLPLAVEALKDIDFMLDEYINDFVL